jgi:hypothetical protein
MIWAGQQPGIDNVSKYWLPWKIGRLGPGHKYLNGFL